MYSHLNNTNFQQYFKDGENVNDQKYLENSIGASRFERYSMMTTDDKGRWTMTFINQPAVVHDPTKMDVFRLCKITTSSGKIFCGRGNVSERFDAQL